MPLSLSHTVQQLLALAVSPKAATQPTRLAHRHRHIAWGERVFGSGVARRSKKGRTG